MIKIFSSLINYIPYLLIILPLCLAIFKWPIIGLTAMVMIIPAEELTILRSGRTLTWLLGVIVLMSWLFAYLSGQNKGIDIPKKINILGLVWLLWSLLSVIWAYDKNLSIIRAINLVQLVTFFILLQIMIRNERQLNMIIKGYFISSCVFALYAISIIKTYGLKRAVLSEAQDPNIFAPAIGMSLVMSPYILKITRPIILRMFVLFGCCLIALGMILTGSRGTFIGLFFSIILFVFFYNLKLKTRFIYIALIVSSFILLIFISFHLGLINEEQLQRIVSVFNIKETGGGNSRINIWSVGWEMVKANPLIGVGLDNFQGVFLDYAFIASLPFGYQGIYYGRDAHNIFLCMIAELGIVGSILFIVFAINIFKKLIENSRDIKAVMGIAVLAFMLITGVTEPIMYRKYFWLSIGLSLVILNLIKERDKVIRRQKDLT